MKRKSIWIISVVSVCLLLIGLAAIITGKTPAENGIYSRKQRELKVKEVNRNEKN